VRKIQRRSFFGALITTPLTLVADAVAWEPGWINLRRIKLNTATPGERWAHVTDLHHKGDCELLQKAIALVNAEKPDFVCFTGDLVEDKRYVSEALEQLQQIKAPLFGIPGNHDYWAKADFKQIAAGFARQGGRWLIDEAVDVDRGSVRLWGVTGGRRPEFSPRAGQLNLLMSHYPVWVERLLPHDRFDLIMSGHSHGGQVRLPFYGALIVPFDVNEYELGMYQTPSGPMYVNPGLGYFYLNVRFCCRPEVTIFES
jgi:uncharacterized protein